MDAFASYWLARRHISELLDAHLQGAATWLAAGKVGEMGANGPPQHSVDGFVGQIWQDGSSLPTDNTDPEVIFDRHARAGFGVENVAGELYRVYTLRKAAAEHVYQVGQPVAFRERTATRSALESLLPIIILIPLVWLGIRFIVNGAFAPLSRASAQAEAVGIDRIEPLDTRQVPDEVKPFTDSINRMIQRLAQSVDFERRFIANAAHELRTPLTALQLQADNLQPVIASANQERFGELRTGIARAGALISQLLRLARADAPVTGSTIALTDVSSVVIDAVTEVLPIAMARHIDIGAEEIVTDRVTALREDIAVAVRNLVANAVRYSPDGGRIDLCMRNDGACVVVEVVDTGPGIAEEHLSRVFERFFRVNPDIEGTGLGLAIVKAIASKYGGSATIRNRDDGQSGVVATIAFPLAMQGGNATPLSETDPRRAT